jgi:uncharacterized membrane protein YgcG
VKRQLSKFHATTCLPSNITPEEKLLTKAQSFVLTDPNTPIIGPLVNRVLALADVNLLSAVEQHEKFLKPIVSWFARLVRQERDLSAVPIQFPNENKGGWMEAYFASVLPEFDHARFLRWLETTKSVSDCLKPVLCMQVIPALPPAPVVLDDDIIGNVAPVVVVSQSSLQASQASVDKRRARSQGHGSGQPHRGGLSRGRGGYRSAGGGRGGRGGRPNRH